MMKQSLHFFYLLVALMIPVTAVSQSLIVGELAFTADGSPIMAGQSVADHLFVRNTYNDQGIARPYDNVVSFKGGDVQTVWFWLNDDEIYNNASVQALTPCYCDMYETIRYNEITYNSLEMNLYLPKGFELVSGMNSFGNEANFDWGERMPYKSTLFYAKKNGTFNIDGITYTPYTVLLYSMMDYGCHLSANDEYEYQRHGALKKDDAPVFALFIKNNNQDDNQGRLGDIIIANQHFETRECFAAGWAPNDYRFFYGTGGNNMSQLFLYYTRVALYGGQGMEPATVVAGDLNGDGAIDISDVVELITRVLDNDFTGLDITVMDCSGDGIVDVSDVVLLIDRVLNGA